MSLPRFSVENEVLVNMLMLIVLVAGGVFAFTLVREMFPESRPDTIAVTAAYPATQPEELEKAVTIKIEEAVRDIEGIEKVNSTVSEGLSMTTLQLYNEVADINVVLDEVKNKVDGIPDLPDDLETITITKAEPMLPVIMVALYGDGDEQDLKRAARELRDEILELPGVSDVTISGVRDDEISVEVRPEKLLEYDITFAEVASAIRSTNVDVSAGNLKGDRAQVAVRTLGEESRGRDLEDLVVKTLPGGATVMLRDVADIDDTFIETDAKSYFNGKRSVNLIVQKTPDQDAIQISTLVQAYVRGKMREPFDPWGYADAAAQPWYVKPFSLMNSGANEIINTLAGRPDPEAVYDAAFANPFAHQFEAQLHTDLARFVRGRLDLMLRNGRAGLLLVVICLNLFLNWRVALWTAIGLPVSFLGTFVAMYLLGATINLLSMFALIIVLGIIVDDAIIIGENIYRKVEEGMNPREAAITGAEEVFWPVTVAVMTTISAFAPLLFIKGTIGDFMKELPIVVLAALSVSLIEALVVLPAHLAHLPKSLADRSKREAKAARRNKWWNPLAWPDKLMRGILQPAYESMLRVALRWRYVTVAVAMATSLMSFGLLIGRSPDAPSAVTPVGKLLGSDPWHWSLGNLVKWEFIQKMDAESMFATVEMPVGTNAREVEARLRHLSDFAMAMPEVKTTQMNVAQSTEASDRGAMGDSFASHLGTIWLELYEADDRERRGLRSSQAVLAELREESERLTGVNSVSWEVMNGGPGGKDIMVRMSGVPFEELSEAAETLEAELSEFVGVSDLDNDFDTGKREVRLRLRGAARPTGITTADLGRHVREATYGAEARRITRNREDVKIMVRYPRQYREEVYNLESMYIPSGATGSVATQAAMTNQAVAAAGGMGSSSRGWVPMNEVAQLTEATGYSSVHRAQQRRTVTVSGEVDAQIVPPGEVLGAVRGRVIPDLLKAYPGLTVEFLGSSEEQSKAFGGLKIATPMALLLIYMLLAGLFRSYFQPVVVMGAIPFGIQGAIMGHWLTDNPMTILSLIGLVALTGILVNDSLVLVDFINQRMRAGMDAFAASIEGAKLRLRPILLTTLTTAAGLTPLMFEKSFQAKFLIPMAVTLTFGLIFATALTLVIVPALNLIYCDFASVFGRSWGWLRNADEHD